ncbi:hypothetical protein ACFX13_006232 [Malus domestica]
MICKPFSIDQKVHARYISQVWKIGIQLENEIERAVRKLMVLFEEKEMRVRTMELKENIEASVKSGSLYDSLNDLADLIGCNQQLKDEDRNVWKGGMRELGRKERNKGEMKK